MPPEVDRPALQTAADQISALLQPRTAEPVSTAQDVAMETQPKSEEALAETSHPGVAPAPPDAAGGEPASGGTNPFTGEEAKMRIHQARQDRAAREAEAKARPGRGDYQAKAQAELQAKGGRAAAA